MITRHQRTFARRFIVAVIAVCFAEAAAGAQPGPVGLAGLRLEDALRLLQTRGLRLVFSSELVTRDMRVVSEPRADSPSEQVGELLAPHGLTAEIGPGGVMLVVRRKRPAREPVRGPAAPTRSRDTPREPDPDRTADPVYRERVTVIANSESRGRMSAGSERRLGPDQMREFGSAMADDPLRLVQALPGVASGDDFRGDYSVRGSPYRHASVVVDGVVAPWLQHAALGRGDTGTMTMLGGDVLQDATLRVGAYPRRDGGQLGPQLDLTLREGSRTDRRLQASAGWTSATVAAEGPLGRSERGSWLVGARKSHVEWPIGRDDHRSTVFGFADVQSKLVYDVRPGHEVALSLVAGLSNVERDDASSVALTDGINRAAMIGLRWRSVVGAHTIVTQRVSALTHSFANRDAASRPAGGGADGAEAYRLDVSRTLFRGVVDAGGQVRRIHGSRHELPPRTPYPEASMTAATVDDIEASWLERSGHVSFQRAVGGGLALGAGLRLADSTLLHRRSLNRWLQAEWSAAPRWLVHGSTGVMHQFPALDEVRGWAAPTDLRPERAAYADIGVGHHVSASLLWDATVFVRRERDALRAPDAHPRLVEGVLAVGGMSNRYENALTGWAHGAELTLEGRLASGTSGWIGYSYGTARHTDAARRESYFADFDQRHALNLAVNVPLPKKTRVGVTFRSGSNFPVPGYLVASDRRLFAGDERNLARLPAYARLDLRAERTFDRARRRFTLFAEGLNVLNRTNAGLSDGVIMPDTREAVGFTERLFPRLVTAGLRVEF